MSGSDSKKTAAPAASPKHGGLGKALYGIATLIVALCSGTGLVPAVRQGLVHFMETRYMHRALNMTYWSQQLFALAFLVFALNLLAYLAIATKRGRTMCRELWQELRGQARSLYADRRPVLVLLAIYTFGMLSIFRSNYYYGGADDLYRAMSGARAWRNFYRYISHFLSVFVHTSPKIMDIAPLTQLLALLVMAVSTVMLIRLFATRQGSAGPASNAGGTSGNAVDESGLDGTLRPVGPLSPLVYLAAIPVGLFPYFLENLSYRYDAPYMALSVFFCIVPFLFSGKLRSFALMSVPCLFLMCLSYQAASGIYIVVCAFCVFRMWTQKEKNARELTAFIATAIICYALTLAVFFALFNVQPTDESYVDKNAYAGAFPSNARAYLMQIWGDFGWSSMKIAALLLLIIFVVLACRTSRRKGLPTLCVALLLLAFSAVFSYGAFLVMGRPLFEPRSMFPFGMVLSLPALCVAGWLARNRGTKPQAAETKGANPDTVPAASEPQAADRIPSAERGPEAITGPLAVAGRAAILVLAYSSLVFAFAYGNAQASQKKYTEFRTTLLLEDLSRIVPADQDDIHIHILSDIDTTLIVKNLARTYPLTTRMLEKLGGHAVIFYLQDLGFGLQAETDKFSDWDEGFSRYPLLVDTRYHSIYADGNVYYILFKEPGLTLRE